MGKNNRQRRREKKKRKMRASAKGQRESSITPVDIFRRQYEVAAGKAGLFELDLRLLANRTPELENFALDNYISTIVPKVIDHFRMTLKDEEIEILKMASYLRNKILHAEMRDIANKIKAESGGVRKFTGVPTEGSEIFQYIRSIVTGDIQGEEVRTRSLKTVGIFGWLLENGSNGSFEQAKSVLEQAIKIIHRLLLVLDGIELTSTSKR